MLGAVGLTSSCESRGGANEPQWDTGGWTAGKDWEGGEATGRQEDRQGTSEVQDGRERFTTQS